MRMFNINDLKRKALTDFFIFKRIGSLDFLSNISQEIDDKNQNKLYDKSTSWKTLLDDSKNLESKIIVDSLNITNFGLIFENHQCAEIYRFAVKKIIPSLSIELDLDDQEQVIEKIVNYIVVHNLHKKSFYTLIKNLKNLNVNLLPED